MLICCMWALNVIFSDVRLSGVYALTLKFAMGRGRTAVNLHFSLQKRYPVLFSDPSMFVAWFGSMFVSGRPKKYLIATTHTIRLLDIAAATKADAAMSQNLL